MAYIEAWEKMLEELAVHEGFIVHKHKHWIVSSPGAAKRWFATLVAVWA